MWLARLRMREGRRRKGMAVGRRRDAGRVTWETVGLGRDARRRVCRVRGMWGMWGVWRV